MNEDFIERLYVLNNHYNPVGRAADYALEISHRIARTLDKPERGTGSQDVSLARITIESIKAIIGGPDYGLTPEEIAEFNAMDGIFPQSRLQRLHSKLLLLQWRLNPVRRGHFYAIDIEARITRTLGAAWRDTNRVELVREVARAIVGGPNYALTPEQIKERAKAGYGY